jgi:serine protease Do
MRTMKRTLIFIGILAWAVAGLGAAYFITEAATHSSPHALAAPPSQGPPAPPAQPRFAPAPSPGTAALSGARALSAAFTHVAATAKPAVVRITTAKGGGPKRPMPRRFHRGPGGPSGPFGSMPDQPGNLFEWWFGAPEGPGEPMPGPRQTGLGSGVIIDQNGYVLTNNHVIEGADTIRVTLMDNRQLTAKVVGADPKTDLALIRLEGAGQLPTARLANSDALQVGEWVVAIGNPYGLEATVTVGVVSAKGRDHLEGGPAYEDFIQTDATINPGNSGGPLVNLDGEVVGINTAIKISQFGMTGIGFAIPSNMARSVAEQLKTGGRVRRAWLGVNIQDVSPDLARGLGQGAPTQGALVAQVQPGSPAEKAGLVAGDVVTAVDGQSAASSKDVQRQILARRIGQHVRLTVWRQGRTLTIPFTAGEMPEDAAAGGRRPGGPGGAPGGPSSYGLELRNLTPDLAERLGVPAKTGGAAITQVQPDGPAHEAGLARGDVIIEVDRRPVRTAEEAAQALKAKRPEGHLLRVRRGDAVLFLVVRPE